MGQTTQAGKFGVAFWIASTISGVPRAVNPLAIIINTNQAVKQPWRCLELSIESTSGNLRRRTPQFSSWGRLGRLKTSASREGGPGRLQ
jgi:hypothetical protein